METIDDRDGQIERRVSKKWCIRSYCLRQARTAGSICAVCLEEEAQKKERKERQS